MNLQNARNTSWQPSHSAYWIPPKPMAWIDRPEANNGVHQAGNRWGWKEGGRYESQEFELNGGWIQIIVDEFGCINLIHPVGSGQSQANVY